MSLPGSLDFLATDNLCGQNLVRIVARGSSIVAELLRLCGNIPEVFFEGNERGGNADNKKYADIMFDFHYLRDPEEFEKKINANMDLLDLDQEFHENHDDILNRFYLLFESIWKYQGDLAKYIDDVNNGFYIQHSIEQILEEVDGRQLLSEALYLYGVMLLIMEDRVPGYVRERMLVAIYRFSNDGTLVNIDDVCKLCRSTGYLPGVKKPKNHPEALFARFAPNPEVVRLVIGRLQNEDIYLMQPSFPNPDHRSTRISTQAAMLYVILYFSPDILHKQKSTMREIVDKHFNDNWVISVYMGQLIDLTVEWSVYSAAQSALDNVITTANVKNFTEKNTNLINSSLEELKGFLTEGVLQQDYLLDHTTALLNCMRSCNVALRWRFLHRRCQNEAFLKIIRDSMAPQILITLLLNTSQLEYTLKGMFQVLLDEKDRAWTEGKDAAADRMIQLSEYFTGEKALTRVKRDENMMKWFSGLAEQVKGLNLGSDHSTSIGRKIQGLIAALEDVEQFEAIDTNLQIKSFLDEARNIFRQMIRTVNIKHEVMHIIENVSDISYAWETLNDYLDIFHDRIRKDPSSVVFLRATFLKTASILDIPLVRISYINSPDAISVAEYYSSELVEFVRKVLEVIPQSVFRVLSEIEQIQTNKLRPIPLRLEAKDLKEYAQLDLRLELAKLTHQVSIFTEGVLLMEKTLLGVIQIEPRQILQEGLRRELVRQIAFAMDKDLSFKELSRVEINNNMSKLAATLDGLKRSIEYLQDYIGIAGLKMYQQELSRVVNYNTEQEANRYLKKKIFDSNSRYQSKAIPIPRLLSASAANSDGAINCMGRVMNAILILTDSTSTVYAPECSAWFNHPAPDQVKEMNTAWFTSGQQDASKNQTVEVCGVRTFALLERTLGPIGLRGLDRLFGFRAVFEFNTFLKFYQNEVHPFRTLLDQVREGLFPEHKIPPNASKLYQTAKAKVEKLMLPLLKIIRRIGQGQLIRRQIANVLKFGCQLDAHLLYQSLDTFNRGVVTDVYRHYKNPDKFPYPDADNPLLFETTQLLEACGMDDPNHKIYITSTPLEGLPVLLFLFLLNYLPKLDYDKNFGALVRRKAGFPLDGVPLTVGISSLLKQFHPVVTKKLISYLGQYIKVSIHAVLHSDVESKGVEIPSEVQNTLIFMNQLCHYSSIPTTVIHTYVPPYLFDAIRLANNKV